MISIDFSRSMKRLFLLRAAYAVPLILCILSMPGMANAQARSPMTNVDLPLSGEAYIVAQQAYADYAAHNYARAAMNASEAIRQRPDVVSLRVLLANALAAQRRYDAANKALSNAIAQLGPVPGLMKMRAQLADIQKGNADALTGESLTLAQQAYKAYADKDYKASADYARQVIALRPDLLRFRLLFIDAAGASGQDEDAWKADLDAVQRFGDNEDLRLRRSFIGNRLAPKASLAASGAFQRGDIKQAIALARQMVLYAPDQVDHRVQLMYILFATGDLSAVETAGAEAIANDDTEIMPFVLRGYALAAEGKTEAADADFAKALKIRDATERNQRIARVIIADVWIARGEPQRALDILTPLRMRDNDTDPPIAQRRFDARQRLAQIAENKDLPTIPLDPVYRPAFDCPSDQFGANCDVYPADPGFASAHDYAIATDKASDADGAVKVAQTAQAAKTGKPDAVAQAEQARKLDRAAAITAARKAVAAAPQMAQHRVELINALMDSGEESDARKEARKAIDDGLLPAMPPLTAAYIAQNAGDGKLASTYFAEADKTQKLSPANISDAGYAAEQAGQNAEAARYLERAIDGAATVSGDNQAPTAQQVYDMRTAHADVTRNWGFNTTLSYRGSGLQPGFSTGSGIANSWQSASELYWRPYGDLGDRMFEVYARLYDNFGVADGGGASGASAFLSGFGARVKPFSQLNTIFAFERLVPIGSQANGDWLARIAYSGGFGSALRVDMPSWWSVQHYAEAGRYLQAGTNYGVAWLEGGRMYRMDKVSPRLTLFPYLVIGANYDSSVNTEVPIGAGVGTSARYWFREDKYNAGRSFVDVSLQYRWRISGDDRARGVIFNTILSY
jgi:Tfp pilus assembly protein PilF